MYFKDNNSFQKSTDHFCHKELFLLTTFAILIVSLVVILKIQAKNAKSSKHRFLRSITHYFGHVDWFVDVFLFLFCIIISFMSNHLIYINPKQSRAANRGVPAFILHIPFFRENTNGWKNYSLHITFYIKTCICFQLIFYTPWSLAF